MFDFILTLFALAILTVASFVGMMLNLPDTALFFLGLAMLFLLVVSPVVIANIERNEELKK